jgi:hypothetical protein
VFRVNIINAAVPGAISPTENTDLLVRSSDRGRGTSNLGFPSARMG